MTLQEFVDEFEKIADRFEGTDYKYGGMGDNHVAKNWKALRCADGLCPIIAVANELHRRHDSPFKSKRMFGLPTSGRLFSYHNSYFAAIASIMDMPPEVAATIANVADKQGHSSEHFLAVLKQGLPKD